MKRLSSLMAAMAVAASMLASDLTVVTYNLRYPNSSDAETGNGWQQRMPYAAGQLQFIRPDVFGTQELYLSQINDLLKALPQYDYIGVGRDDGKENGEHSAIFYNRDNVRLVDSGNFWISETPDMPSKGWDANNVRICTWGHFETLDGTPFYYFNMHMDHIGVTARREGGRLILSKIKEIAPEGATVILSGDFNVDQSSEVYDVFASSGILDDSYGKARYRFAPNGTYNAFKPQRTTPSRIDHIFVSPSVDVDRYAILTDMYWAPETGTTAQTDANAPKEVKMKRGSLRNISDHYPVVVKINIK